MTKQQTEPPRAPGVLPGTPAGDTGTGPGILPGTPAEVQEPVKGKTSGSKVGSSDDRANARRP